MDQVRTKGDADDEIMVQVNKKVEEWKVRHSNLLYATYHFRHFASIVHSSYHREITYINIMFVRPNLLRLRVPLMIFVISGRIQIVMYGIYKI